MDEIRLDKRSHGPEFEQEDEVVLWAHDDGSLRVTDEDGDETTLGSGGGSTPVSTVVDEVLFSDFELEPGESPSWPGRAPFRTITANQVVLRCLIVVVEAFNDSGAPSEIQVTDDPDGDGVQLSSAPTAVNVGNHVGGNTSYVRNSLASLGTTAAGGGPGVFRPFSGDLDSAIVGLNAFVGDGTTGRALIFTTIYTPS